MTTRVLTLSAGTRNVMTTSMTCSDIEGTSGGGEHERGYCHSGKRIRGISLEKLFDIWLPLFAFLMHFGPEFQHSWADLEQAALAYPQWTIDIELTIQSQDLK